MSTFCSAMLRMLTVSILMAIASSALAQQAYPSKAIRFIIPYPPGGSATPIARIIGQKLTESWGQQVIVDNRGGGNTVIASELLVKSPPDGYTILLMDQTIIINPNLITTSYDAIKDFAPVATVNSSVVILGANPSVPANTLQEVIALAKSKPGELNYASAGSGGLNHLSGELFNILTGAKIQHVPYKGGGPAVTDLMGGQVQLCFFSPFILPQIKSGKLKAIAVTGRTRMPALPHVPTFSEAGLPGFDVKGWYGVLAPAATPKPIIDKLSAEIGRILAMPDVKEQLDRLGVDPFISTPEEFGTMMKTELSKWANVIKTAKIKLEQ